MFTALEYNASAYEGVLPPFLIHKLNKDSRTTFLFGGREEDGTLNSIAVFSLSPIHNIEMVLEYIYVAEESRFQNLASELLEFCYERFRRAGIRIISCKICGDISTIKRGYDFLVRKKFTPVSFQGHLLTYSLDSIMNNPKMRQLAGIPLISVFPGNRLPLDIVKTFRSLAASHKFYMPKESWKSKYNQYHMRGRAIKAGFFMEQTAPDTMFITQIFIDPACKDQYVFPMLFLACIKEAVKRLPADGKIQIQFFQQRYYEALMKLLPDNPTDYLIQEFALSLDKRKEQK